MLLSDFRGKENDGTTGTAQLIPIFLAQNQTLVVCQAP
jgi:hypothetical protein